MGAVLVRLWPAACEQSAGLQASAPKPPLQASCRCDSCLSFPSYETTLLVCSAAKRRERLRDRRGNHGPESTWPSRRNAGKQAPCPPFQKENPAGTLGAQPAQPSIESFPKTDHKRKNLSCSKQTACSQLWPSSDKGLCTLWGLLGLMVISRCCFFMFPNKGPARHCCPLEPGPLVYS